MIQIRTDTQVLFEGSHEEYRAFCIREKFRYAFSYTLPFWRVLFYSTESNYQYWKQRVYKRLGYEI